MDIEFFTNPGVIIVMALICVVYGIGSVLKRTHLDNVAARKARQSRPTQ